MGEEVRTYTSLSTTISLMRLRKRVLANQRRSHVTQKRFFSSFLQSQQRCSLDAQRTNSISEKSTDLKLDFNSRPFLHCLCFYPTIYPSIHPSVRPSIHLIINPSNHPSSHSFNPFFRSFVSSFILSFFWSVFIYLIFLSFTIFLIR